VLVSDHSSLKLVAISVDVDTTDQLLIRYCIFVRYWRENGSIMEEYVTYL